MKAILYFVASGIVREAHREAATAINAATGKRVVFRNGTVSAEEKPEANEGVAGKPIPPQYSGFTRFDDSGKEIAGDTPATPASEATGGGNAPERKLNAIGLPDGEDNPEDREALKEALTAEGIEFHGNASTEKLAGLYMAHFYPEG